MAPLFSEIISSFDQKPFKPLLENEIYNLIHKQIPEDYDELSTEEKAELIAFRFLEPGKNKNTKSNFYFQPLAVTTNEDGTTNEFPSVAMVTRSTIAYWLERSKQSLHPVLAARYSGLVYDFSLHVTSLKAPFFIIKKYIESLIDLVEQGLYKVPVYAIGKISRALEVSISINNQDLIDRCKNAIRGLEAKIGIRDKPGLWGFSYDLLIDGKKKLVLEPEETSIVQDLEQRFQDMLMIDAWCAECAARRLMGYYFKQKRPDEIKRILKDLEASYNNSTNGLAAIQKVHYTEQLYQFYKQFQLNEEAEEILKRLRELSKDTNKDMKAISSELGIPKEKIDNYVNQVLRGENIEMIFARIIEAGTPRVEEAKQELDFLSKQAPLQYILTKELLDKKGRRVAKIGPLLEDMEGHLVLHIANSIRIGAVLLQPTLGEAKKRELFTTHEIVKFLRKSCIIENDRFDIIQKGIDTYFAGDYMTALHLLIPQFEEAIRNLVEMNGGSVMIQKNDAFNLKTFDHLLNDEIIKEVFGEDKAFYFRVLFTDKRGWNIRNNIAHGMLDSEHFYNKQNIDRILHALLCLGMVRYRED